MPIASELRLRPTAPGRRPAAEPAAAGGAVTCVVADDHPVVLNAVADFLAGQGMRVVGRAGDGRAALELIAARRPRVAVVDLRMPRVDGIEVARATRRESPETSVVLFADQVDRATVAEALDAGVRGLVLKQAPLPELLRAVTLGAGGLSYLDPVLAGALVAAPEDEAGARLTAREREVLRLLADGLSNEQIGQRLFIGAETVRTHIRKAMTKLGAGTRTEAVATALRRSLIS